MGIDSDKLLVELSDGAQLDEDVEHKLIVMIDEAVQGKSGRQASVDDVYGYVLVLGKAKSKKAVRVFNKLLEEWRDPLTVSKVIEIICLEWDRFEDYLERIISFAVGVSWDEDEDVKQSAIRILGEYLASGLSLEAGRESNRDLEITLSDDQREVVLFLLRTFFDRTLESWTRQSAYCALLRASGVRAQGLPNDCVMLDFTPGSTDIDWGSVAFLQSLVDEENSSSSSSKPSADDVLGGPAIR